MKTLSLIGKNLLAFVLCIWASTAFAIQPIPQESGFSGFINAGAVYLDIKSNMISGIKGWEVGKQGVDSIHDKPDSESEVLPQFNFEFAYTFADTRTQVYAGNTLEDFLRFELTNQAGVRQEMADSSVVGAAFVFTSVPTEVWEDPYVANQSRRETEGSSRGVRLIWGNILDANLDLQYTWRKIGIDDERSGTLGGLGLTPAERALLDREGNHHRMELSYMWDFGDRHYVVPAFEYHKLDLDGDAMANDRYGVQLTYGYKGNQFSLVANASYIYADYDTTNPIYNKKREDDIYGGALTGIWHRPFGMPKGWSLTASVLGYKADANIDFYDTDVVGTILSVLYRF
jgi:hypothetical protein